MGDHKTAERLRERVLTRGEVSLAEWHRMLRFVVFLAALALMTLSLVALHWALALVGIPGALAFAGAVCIEIGMACVASTATTIRKPRGPGKNGQPRQDGYYLSLWAIFSFMMALAQGANVGHAVVEVSGQIGQLPAWVPPRAVYVFAGAFAALFPLGGTLFIHVSGFIRAHGADAQWIDPDAESVRVRDDSTPAPRVLRARPERAAQAPVMPAPSTAAAPAQSAPADAQPPEIMREEDERKRARILFDRAVAADPTTKPDAAQIRRDGRINNHPATVRRWVSDMWADVEAQRAATPDEGLIWLPESEPKEPAVA